MKIKEISQYSDVRIDENDSNGASIALHFRVLNGDAPTQNGHIYSDQILTKCAQDFTTRIEKQGPAYGSLGHVKGGPEVSDVSHIITGVHYDKNEKQLWADAKILPTQKGKNLAAILKAGGKVGISARGEGELDSDGNVKNYSLKGIDMTLNPANEGSWIGPDNIVYESASLDEAENDIVNVKYQAARQAGFRGTKQEYIEKVYVPNKPAGKIQDEPGQAALNLTEEDNPDLADILTDDEVLALFEALPQAVKKLGPSHHFMGASDTHVMTFDDRKSQHYKTPYTFKDGAVQLGEPSEPIDANPEDLE